MALTKVEVLPEDLNLAIAKKPKDMSHLKAYQFSKGESGNPGGRKLGARNTIQKTFLVALAKDFDKHGENTIGRARKRDPLGYIKVVAALLPKQLEKVAPLEELSDEELAASIEFIRSKMSITSQSK